MSKPLAVSWTGMCAHRVRLRLHAGLLCALLFAISLSTHALSPGANFPDYAQERWTVEDGLPQISVTAIAQDAHGYLWVSTQNGIARFDGSVFRVFNRANTGLDVNLIGTAFADSRGSVWFGSPRGVLQFDQNQATLHQSPDDPLQVLDVIEWPDGRILLATARGVRDVAFEPVYLQSEAINAMAIDGNGALWLGGRAAVWRVDSSGIRRIALSDRHARVTHLSRYGARMAVGTTAGAFLLDVGTGDANPVFPLLAGSAITSMTADRDGNLWAAVVGKLQRLRPNGEIELVDTLPLLEQPWLHTLFEDSNGDLWLGDQRESLIRVSDNAVHVLGRERGLRDELLWSVLDDTSGGLWVGSNSGLQQWLPEGRFDAPLAVEGLSDPMIYSLFRDAKGTVWAGTGSGPAILQDGKLDVPAPLRDIRARVTSFAEDGDTLWLGTLDGLWRVRDSSAKRVDYRAGSPLQRIRHLWLESPGQLLVASEGGVRRIVGDASLRPEWAEPLEGDIVTQLAALRPDTQLIATFDRGIGRLQNGQLTLFSRVNGLPTNNAWSFAQVADHVYVSSSDGVYRIRMQDLLSAAPDALLPTEIVVESVSRSRGVRRMGCCNGGGGSRLAVIGQTLSFPTTRGLVQLESAQIRAPGSAPRPVIERVTVNGMALPLDAVMTPDGGSRDLSIEYAAIDLRHADRSEFRYRLVGYKDMWTEVGDRRLAVFTGLPPGEYRFELEARFPGHAWRSADYQPLVYIVHRWHERLPVRLAGLALSIWIMVLLFRRYTARQRAQRSWLEQEVQSRTIALARANERLRAANQALLEESRTDVLTGIANRRAALQALADTDHYSVLLLDIDDFKSINDRFGHAAGDRVLNDIAIMARELTPLPGLVARWGGEEFLLVLPQVTLPDAMALAERLRLQIASHAFFVTSQQSLQLSASLGVSLFPLPGAPEGGWPLTLELADRALYRAKSEGKNRVVGLQVEDLPRGWKSLDIADIDTLIRNDAVRWYTATR